jgi:hypothetical protein
VGGDVPFVSEAHVVIRQFQDPIHRPSLSEMLIGVGYMCVHRSECMRVYVNICVCTVSLKRQGNNDTCLRNFCLSKIAYQVDHTILV